MKCVEQNHFMHEMFRVHFSAVLKRWFAFMDFVWKKSRGFI
uniref:Uncharacterized protein n=1 Tax=Meloidogyne enterolobii TaxID=390850 RepID=A0A6V7V398_MELEN|nr:unnamed protein product [Meloidogyne enterolobii]